MIVHKGYKYRLKTNFEQEQVLRLFAGHCRFVWNKALDLQMNRLNHKVPVLNYHELTCLLKLWKHSEEWGFLKEAHSQIEQQVLKDLDRALWDGLKKNKGMPKFKKRGMHDSFRFPQGFKIQGNQVYLPKIGWIRFIKSRDIVGTPKSITVSQYCGHWYVSILAEQEVEQPIHPSSEAVGIDMGIVRFTTLSDASFIEPLNSFKKLEGKLAHAQRKLSKKKTFSQNWHKQKARVSKIQCRIAYARQDFLHKASTAISKSHAVIVLEDLKVSNMSRSASGTIDEPGRNVRAKSGLNKAILDQGWAEFRRQLEYKEAWLGGMVIAVPPRNTSRTCPVCGHISADNRKTQASFKCINCGFEANADHVAACNILAAGLAVIACGDGALAPSVKQEPLRKVA